METTITLLMAALLIEVKAEIARLIRQGCDPNGDAVALWGDLQEDLTELLLIAQAKTNGWQN